MWCIDGDMMGCVGLKNVHKCDAIYKRPNLCPPALSSNKLNDIKQKERENNNNKNNNDNNHNNHHEKMNKVVHKW